MNKTKVYFFEDNKVERNRLKTVLGKAFGAVGAEVIPITKIEGSAGTTYTQALETNIGKKNLQETRLIIADHDLSQVSGGLSAESVKALANKYWIPVVLYAQGLSGKRSLEEELKWSDFSLVLDASRPDFARDCVSIFSGFQQILSKCQKGIKTTSPEVSPAGILANLLGKPEYESHLSLYSIGNTSFINNALAPAISSRADKDKQLAVMLGYWLYDSILRYPGVIINDAVASSFLDIDPAEFSKDGVRKLFESAKYLGPFHEMNPYWWRHDLKNIYLNANCSSGKEYAIRKLKNNLKPCLCSHPASKPHSAGYYCVVTNKPVCAQHSRSNISWFPKGADLARIAEKAYRKLAPRLGL